MNTRVKWAHLLIVACYLLTVTTHEYTPMFRDLCLFHFTEVRHRVDLTKSLTEALGHHSTACEACNVLQKRQRFLGNWCLDRHNLNDAFEVIDD